MVKNLLLFLIAYIGVVIATPIVLIINLVRKWVGNQNIKKYIEDCAIGYDQAGGSILYQQENFTISSYTYFLCKYKNNKYACIFMRLVDFIFGKAHCKNSYVWEIKKDKNDLINISKDE